MDRATCPFFGVTRLWLDSGAAQSLGRVIHRVCCVEGWASSRAARYSVRNIIPGLTLPGSSFQRQSGATGAGLVYVERLTHQSWFDEPLRIAGAMSPPLLLAFCLVTGDVHGQPPEPGAGELLSRVVEAQKWLGELSMEVHVDLHGKGPAYDALGHEEIAAFNFAQFDDRVLVIGKSWFAAESDGTKLPGTATPIRRLVNSQFALSGFGVEDALRFGRDTALERRKIYTDPTLGLAIEGYVPGSDQQSVVELLLASDRLEVASEQRSVGGLACHFLEGESDYGLVKAWVCPSAGYQIVKWVIEKRSGHFFDDVRLGDPDHADKADGLLGWRAEMTDVELAAFDTIHLPVRGVLTITVTKEGLPDHDLIFRYERRGVQLGPEAATEALSSGWIADGTAILEVDASGVKYEWRDGHIVPRVDEHLVRFIESEVTSFRAHGAATLPLSDGSYTEALPEAYCGVNTLYAASLLLREEGEYSQLVAVKYIGASEGSSIAELVQAAEQLNLVATPVANLTPAVLRSSEYPIVLHVRHNSYAEREDHFVLAVSADDDAIVVFDPPSRIMRMPFHEIVSRWNGHGLVLSPEPISLVRFFGPTWRNYGIGLVVSILLVAVFRFLRRFGADVIPTDRFNSRLVLSAMQAGMLLVTASTFGVTYHFWNRDGFLAQPRAIEAAEKVHAAKFLPKVTIEEGRVMHEVGAIFVDARPEADYQFGQIEGSINVPSSLGAIERHARMDNVAPDDLIVVYCSKKTCNFAALLATSLYQDGFTNVHIMPAGVEGWYGLNAQ